MQKQEQQEQPKPKEPKYQYFWSATLYSILNLKTENAYGVIGADTGQDAVDQLQARYAHGDRYRAFALVALNRV